MCAIFSQPLSHFSTQFCPLQSSVFNFCFHIFLISVLLQHWSRVEVCNKCCSLRHLPMPLLNLDFSFVVLFLIHVSIFSPISVSNLCCPVQWSRGNKCCPSAICQCHFSCSSVKFMLPSRSSAKYYQLQPVGTNTNIKK